MKHIWAIAAKELRGYFNSAVALLFLATFLVAVMLFFFFVERFFARNIADVRPFFDWLPLLLIFLVSALTMRLWSEEQKTGTLELLLTLPVPIHRLVLGKFLASLILVAIALVLTLGLPITVSQLGELDWGPVIGGYLAALLLAGAYLSVGLCVSATTENQIVALIATAVVCFLLYLPGMQALTSLVSIDTGEFLRMLGTGSRFESIARGVLDLRDLAYYVSIMAVFLSLNTMLLRAKGWGSGQRSRTARRNTWLAVVLIAGNAIALNIWLRPIHAARIDITEHGLYSLSPSTEKILDGLEEPITIRGYFTSKIHDDIDPLVPQIKDMLREYQIAGDGNVRLEFIDPSEDEDLEKEANEEYNIQSLSIMSQDRHGRSVINAYFHVLVMYGSQTEVLSFEHLVRMETDGTGKPLFFLDNIEYEVTRSIRKAVQGFQSVESLFAEVSGNIVIEAYVSRTILPAATMAVTSKMDALVEEFSSQSDGKIEYQSFSDPQQLQERANELRITPYILPVDGKQTPVYFHWFVRIGDRRERIEVIADEQKSTTGVLRQSVINALRRTVPGFIRVVGLITPSAGAVSDAALHAPAMELPSPQKFSLVEKEIGDLYAIKPVDLAKGPMSDDFDVLVVAGPEKLKPRELLQLDQFLMRGGSMILLMGNHRPRKGFTATPSTEIVTSNMDPLLAAWGIKVGEHLIVDPRADRTILKLGRRLQDVFYPMFLRLDRNALKEGGIITNGVRTATMHFSTPLTPVPVEGAGPVETTILMRSSSDAWLHKARSVIPDFTAHPGLGFARPATMETGDPGPHVLAVAMTGTFKSAFAHLKAPGVAAGRESLDTLLDKSPEDTRLVVVGSSAFASDEMLAMAAQFGMETVDANVQFVHNLVDWALEDTELLSIRAIRTTGTLNVDADGRTKWEWMNYILVIVVLLLVVGVSRLLPRPKIDRSSAAPAADDDDIPGDDISDDDISDDDIDDDDDDDDDGEADDDDDGEADDDDDGEAEKGAASGEDEGDEDEASKPADASDEEDDA